MRLSRFWVRSLTADVDRIAVSDGIEWPDPELALPGVDVVVRLGEMTSSVVPIAPPDAVTCQSRSEVAQLAEGRLGEWSLFGGLVVGMAEAGEPAELFLAYSRRVLLGAPNKAVAEPAAMTWAAALSKSSQRSSMSSNILVTRTILPWGLSSRLADDSMERG